MATNIPGDINQTKQRNAAPVAKKQTSFDITNTPGLKPAGIPATGKPAATPGYDAQPVIRNAQAADDRLQQAAATPPVATPGYDGQPVIRNAQAADDRLQQYSGHPVVGANGQTSYQGVVDRSGAVQPKAVAQPAAPAPQQQADDQLASYVAGVTGKRQGDTMTPQDLQALGLNTAAGLMVQQNLVNQPGAGDNPARAARMQASYDQPATGGNGVPIQQVAAGPAQQQQAQGQVADGFEGFGNRVKNFSTGAAQTGAGLIATIPAAVIDYGRQGLAAVSGGQLTDQQKTQAGDAVGNFTGQGIDKLTSAFDGEAQAVRSLIGATEAPPTSKKPVQANPAAQPDKASPEEKSATTGSQTAQGALPSDQYTKTGIGTNAEGGEIVGRTGANGVKEFSNMPNDQLAALDPSQSSFRVQGQQGDARSALEIGDAKNAQLRQTVALQRGHEVGNGPGNVGQVSSTTIEQAARKAKITGSATDRAAYDSLVKLDAGQAADRIEQNGKQQPGWKMDAEKAAAQATTAKAETDQKLNAATSQQQAARARNLAALEAAIVDPNATPEERAEARRNYDVLTTSVKDRYFDVKGGDTADGAERPSAVFDATTGTWVEQGGSQASNNAAPPGMTLTGQTRDGKKVYTDANGNKHVES